MFLHVLWLIFRLLGMLSSILINWGQSCMLIEQKSHKTPLTSGSDHNWCMLLIIFYWWISGLCFALLWNVIAVTTAWIKQGGWFFMNPLVTFCSYVYFKCSLIRVVFQMQRSGFLLLSTSFLGFREHMFFGTDHYTVLSGWWFLLLLLFSIQQSEWKWNSDSEGA